MAENKLTDARVRSASHERDGAYLSDGGGLRVRLLPPSRNHPKGARLCEFHFKLKDTAGAYKNGALHLGTIGEPFTDPEGQVRAFTLADARRARNEARELVAAGTDPRDAARLVASERAEEQRRRMAALDGQRTVRQAFARWRDLYLAAHHKDGGLEVERLFERHVLSAFGERPLRELRRSDVTDLLDKLTAEDKRRTANIALQLLRQFARWCLIREWLDKDPTFSITKAAAGGRIKPRERVLSQLEIVALRDKLPQAGLQPRMVHAVWLLLATGARVGELSAAKVEHFDLEAGTWHMPETKNGEPHLVHLSAFALAHVRALLALDAERVERTQKNRRARTARRAASVYLLPSRSSKSSAEDDEAGEDRPLAHYAIAKMLHDRQRAEPLKGRAKAVGVLTLPRGEWTPHDLRRTMATRMREDLRISSDVIERCLNHKPQGIVAVYQRGELLTERKEAFEAWGRELGRLMTVSLANVAELPVREAA